MKKLLVIAPHQDDEINLAGGVIYKMRERFEIHVMYVTEGDYIYSAKIRHREAEKSLKILGVRKSNIHYLGFSDCSYDAPHHVYNEDAARVVEAIKKLVNRLRPEIIVCADLDFHPDHIMTSLCFERALGQILKEDETYRPEVLKTFAYENSYLGSEDFHDNRPALFKVDSQRRLINNPYYNIKDKISIKNDKRCLSFNLVTNPLWRAIKAHRSQVLIGHAFRMMNTDYAYWGRRTDSLLLRANICATSGRVECLNDFLLCNTSNVLNGDKRKIDYDTGFWAPDSDDKKKIITITLPEKAEVGELRIYKARPFQGSVMRVKIIYDGNTKMVESGDLVLKIDLDVEVKKIQIEVLNREQMGISELELFAKGVDGSSEMEEGGVAPVSPSKITRRLNRMQKSVAVLVSRCFRKYYSLTARSSKKS